ncbi:MAG: diguanylate cyclase [Desulfuromonadales bacterium]|nr:diguanylate cyclase [Desulfuromonadales bacterium]MBN2793250.1 diguanylate cyclase [Desulfuromonadales bacterium]
MKADGPWRIKEKIGQVFSSPFELGEGVSVNLTASLGIGIYPDDGETPRTVLKAADREMYGQKQRKKQRRPSCQEKILTNAEICEKIKA